MPLWRPQGRLGVVILASVFGLVVSVTVQPVEDGQQPRQAALGLG
ncbi:hypothetical protein [Kaistia granuli]|nr:hypothetical protein [Kaistia granuli]